MGEGSTGLRHKARIDALVLLCKHVHGVQREDARKRVFQKENVRIEEENTAIEEEHFPDDSLLRVHLLLERACAKQGRDRRIGSSQGGDVEESHRKALLC